MKENDVQGKVFEEIAKALGMGAGIVTLAAEKVNRRLANTREAATQIGRDSLKRAIRYGRSSRR